MKTKFQIGDRVVSILRNDSQRCKIGEIVAICTDDNHYHGEEKQKKIQRYDVRYENLQGISCYTENYLLLEEQYLYKKDFQDKIKDRIK